MSLTMTPIEIGWIPYLNLVPFYAELRRLAGGSLNFISGHPSTVNKWLMDGVVDLAPASSISLLNAEQLRVALPLGIASEGAVHSVYLGLHREHEDFWQFVRRRQQVLADLFRKNAGVEDVDVLARTLVRSVPNDGQPVNTPNLLLTPASAASAALSKVLLHLWCGRDRAFRILSQAKTTSKSQLVGAQSGDRAMELVIGDEALARRPEFWKILDLGQVWHELTRLPFVFGLWQTRKSTLPVGWVKIISEAAAISQARMQIEPEAYFADPMPLATDGSPIDLSAYWSVIQYKLGPRHFKSLLLYYNLYQQVVGVQDDACANKLLTWSKSDFFDLASPSV